MGGKKPPRQKAARFVQSFRYYAGLWRTDRQADDGHTTTAYTALA